jgi:ribosome modulation factor
MNNEAFDEGYDAYWEGVDVSDNPYDAETQADARLSWKQGWRKARQHDYDESEG